MHLEETQQRIRTLMSQFVTEIKAATAMDKTDINKISENILIPLLAEITDFQNLENLNFTEGSNFPGIDLGDKIAKVAFQITSTSSIQKIKDTLKQFVTKGLYNEYDRLIIYILTEKQNSYSNKGISIIVANKFNFNLIRDVWDFSILLNKVNKFSIEKASKIEKILEANFGTKKMQIDSKQVPKDSYKRINSELEKTLRLYSTKSFDDGFSELDQAYAKSFHTPAKILETIDKEIILPISYAKDFDVDGFPCDPRHFVGRENKREDFWNFINNVKDRKSLKRVIGFQGHSGIGKSSLILKLKAESEEIYSNEFFIYQVDVKFAQTNFFGAIAIKKAIVQATKKGFINLPQYMLDEIKIKDSSFFSQLIIQEVLRILTDTNKVIIIFFDHFEYLLRQSRFSNAYFLIENLIYELYELEPNIVLGFSWTTGMSSILNENIRVRWDNLSERRQLFVIEEFTPKDAKEYIEVFRNYLKERKNNQTLKKLSQLDEWLLEKCSSFPWLIRKLFTNLYKDSQFPLKYQQIDGLVIDMLEYDLKDLHPKEIECLKKIADLEINDTPVSYDLFAPYEKEIEILIRKRFIIRSNSYFKPYYTLTSDILREYILTNKVQLPDFSMTYIPKRPVSFILRVFRMLSAVNTKQDLINKLLDSEMIKNNLKPGTVDNIVSDLRHFFQVEYDAKNGSFLVLVDLLKLDDNGIADYLGEQLREHLIIKTINKNKSFQKDKIRPGYFFNRYMFKDLLKTIYSEKSNLNKLNKMKIITQKTNKQERDKFDHYTSRLLSWLYFAGLIEKRETKSESELLIPINRHGRHKGKIAESEEYIQLKFL